MYTFKQKFIWKLLLIIIFQKNVYSLIHNIKVNSSNLVDIRNDNVNSNKTLMGDKVISRWFKKKFARYWKITQ